MHDFTHLDRLLQSIVQDPCGPVGCACGVAQGDDIVFEGYYGQADREAGRAMDADALFDIWSLTKLVPCTAAMMLFERGAFLLNDPLYEYFPEYRDLDLYVPENRAVWKLAKAQRPILVKDAFTMACGIPAMGPPDHPSVRAMHEVRARLREEHGKFDLRTEIRAMAQVPLVFEPGSHWMYSYGHELVAGLIEVCSGLSVGEFMRRNLFDPLGLRDMGYRYEAGWRQRMCAFYNLAEDGTKAPARPGDNFYTPQHEPDDVYEGGGGGLIASLRDFLTFCQCLANGGTLHGVRIIGRKTLDLMRRNQLSPQQLADFYENAQNAVYMPGYGYGLGVRTLLDPAQGYANTSPGEYGWTGGSGTWAAIDPSEQAAVVYMHQMWPNREAYFHPRVRAAAFGGLA